MLMEDEDDIARLVTHRLNPGGFRTYCPERPQSLIPDAEKDRPALFILDLEAPRSGRIPTVPQYQGTSESERLFRF